MNTILVPTIRNTASNIQPSLIKVYFKGLNELRGIAALGVLVHHIELYKYREGHSSLYNTEFKYFIDHLGKNSVFLFFVLSGFLITYLLIKELEQNKFVDIKSFYFRRALRIWPLYYLITIVSFFVVPIISQSNFFKTEGYYLNRINELEYGWNLILFLILFSNFALKFFKPVVGAAQTWSVSVEEQFYFIWPWLFKYFHKHIVFMLITIVIVKPLGVYTLVLLNNKFIDSEVLKTAIYVLDLIKVELMAIGGLGAYFLHKMPSRVHSLFKNKVMFALSIVLTLILMSIWSNPLILGLSFMLLIYSTINSKLYIPQLDYLGKVSYGIYMYHSLIMFFVFAFIHYCLGNEKSINILVYNGLVYGLIILLTLLISSLSYTYFESYFLRFKSKFQKIHSGNI